MGEAKGGGVEKRAHARKAGGAELSTNFSKLYQLNSKNFIYYGSHPIGHILGCIFVQFCSPLTGNTFQPAKSIDY